MKMYISACIGFVWLLFVGFLFPPVFETNFTSPMVVMDVHGIPGLEEPGMTCRYCM